MNCLLGLQTFSTMVILTSNRNIRHLWILCPAVTFQTKFINGNIFGLLATAVLRRERVLCSGLCRSCSVPGPTPQGPWQLCLCNNQEDPGAKAVFSTGWLSPPWWPSLASATQLCRFGHMVSLPTCSAWCTEKTEGLQRLF